MIIEASISTIETMEDRRYAAMLYKASNVARLCVRSDSESATHIRVTYRCTDEGDGTDSSEPSAAGQHLELFRRASDPRDRPRLHGSVGALDAASAQSNHGGRPPITHVSSQETNKCAFSQTLP